MKHWGQTLAGGILVGGFALLLFSFPDQSAEAARKGIGLCLDLIIPSLFPFFVLSSLVISTGLGQLLARPLERPMRLLFGVGSSGASLLVLGAIGGYPAGARTLVQMVAQEDCSLQEAKHLYLFCNNCGPAFFIGVVGGGLFGSRDVGFLLWGTHLLAALLIGLFHRAAPMPPPAKRTPILSPLSAQLPEAVRSSFLSVLNICAYVILFSVLTGLLTAIHSLPSDPLGRSLCLGFLEISTGVSALGQAVSSPVSLPLAAFLLGWGGCSVHCQTLPFWRELGLSTGPYLLAKACQGLLAAGLTLLFSHLLPLTLPVMAPTSISISNSLLDRELTALWTLAGCYAVLTKKGGKGRQKTV